MNHMSGSKSQEINSSLHIYMTMRSRSKVG